MKPHLYGAGTIKRGALQVAKVAEQSERAHLARMAEMLGG